LQPLPGYSEQDPQLIFEAVLGVLGKALDNIHDKENLGAVCFSAAMHSLMAININGKPLTSLLTWADTRSRRYAALLKDTEAGKRIYLDSGTAVHPMSPLCKIAWIRNELPEVFAGTYKFISIKEFIFYKLFGQFKVDYSVASATGLFNNFTLKWNEESLSFAGIDENYLSEPVPVTHAETALLPEYVQRFNLNRQLTFYIGASDGCLAILGSGATRPDEAGLTIGTSGAIRKLSAEPLQDKQGRLFNYLLTENLFMSGGGTNNGGIVLKWFAENILDKTFASDEAFSWFMQTAAQSPAGSRSLIFLPYVNGERSPVWDADARGVFMGVSSLHGKQDMMRAVLEGICFSLYQILQAMETNGPAINTVYASGGFINSDLWLQMLADILNKKVIVSHAADASAMGAIFLALYALGEIKEWHETKPMVETSAVYTPDPAAHEIYLKNFRVFEKLYDKLRDDFAVMAG
jgi:gluconokinase